MTSAPAPWRHQTEAADFAEDKPGVMLAMEMGTGKDLRNDTPLATPDGWVNIGDVNPGTTLFDEKGVPCTVANVYPQGESPVLKVTFDDGTEIFAGPDHLWITIPGGEDRGGVTGPGWALGRDPVTTLEIAGSLETGHRIPSAGDGPARLITGVTPMRSASTTCITVDSPSGLFLAGRAMVPTHNTKIAIDLIHRKEHKRVLVLCPLSIVDYVWPQQVATHQHEPIMVVPLGARLNGVKAKRQAAEKAMRRVRDHTTLMVVVNYESSWREPLASWIASQKWDLLVMDESHKLKTHDGKASLWVSKISGRIGQRIALTGTPMPNTPLDIFAQFRALDKSVYGTSYHAFRDRFALFDEILVPVRRTRTKSGQPAPPQLRRVQRFRQMKNEEELNSKFYEIAYRVTADEALDLPETSNTYLEFNLGPKAQRIYDELHAEFRSEVVQGAVTNATNALSRLLRLQQVTSGFAVTDDGEIQIDDAKERALEEVLDSIDTREPAVVFARFRHDLEMTHRVAERLGRESYELSGPRKELEQWKEGGGVLAVQIQAGGLGVDLTMARYCIYVSLGFSLGDYQQSMARLHRPGQERKVVYTHLIAAGTVDNDVIRALEKKARVIEYILQEIQAGDQSRGGETA